YALNGNYTTFNTDIGLDDSSHGMGSVIFYVVGDGAFLYVSGAMTAADGARSIELDVSGVKELTLLTYAANGGDTSTPADWANARLTPLQSVAVSDLPLTIVRNGWGPAELDKSNGELLASDGKILTLNGVVYDSGLGVHAPSEIIIS